MKNGNEYLLEDFPLRTWDKIRFRDTDSQGHVNNAVFSTFLETGRTELLYNPDNPLNRPGASFVIVKQILELKKEILWPGSVDIGTKIKKIGTSSIELIQCVFQNKRYCAYAETVIVQIDDESRKSAGLTPDAKAELLKYT